MAITAAIKSVKIQGDGIAAWCCARLLTNSGISVSIERTEARFRPWILVNEPVQKLLREISGNPDLFRDAPQIRKRHVLWGVGNEPACLDHSAALMDESEFLNHLWPRIPSASAEPDFAIRASGPNTHHFGTRQAQIAAVETRTRESCWIESFPHGWLFLIAGSSAAGSLIAVGATPQELLDRSRLILPQIVSIGQIHEPVPAYPRISDPLFGADYLACGSAAMSLDPICGDGSGHAVREAILATAVIRGSARSGMLEHYQSRLHLAFERHLALCRNYYLTGNSGPWWDAEASLLDHGLEWTRRPTRPTSQYRLNGIDLEQLPDM